MDFTLTELLGGLPFGIGSKPPDEPSSDVPPAVPPPLDTRTVDPGVIANALKCWQASCCQQAQGSVRSMSPMDEATWFALPKWSYLQMADPNIVQQFLAANPQRIALYFRFSAVCVFSTDPSMPVDQGFGFLNNPALEPIRFYQYRDANLVQSAWYGFTPTPVLRITVVELLLKDWPAPPTAVNQSPTGGVPVPQSQPETVPSPQPEVYPTTFTTDPAGTPSE